MSAPKVKTKLNSECKLALLNQAAHIRYSARPYVSVKSKAFKFFKLLIISKSFIYCSRRFEVYRLRFDLLHRLHNGIRISVLREKGCLRSYLFGFILSLAQLKAFLGLFRPAFFGIQQGYYLIHRHIKEIYELLRLTDGKICLFFNEIYGEICHLRLVEAFSSRVYELKCSGELLEDESLPNLRLENCEIFNLEGIDQLAKILRHNIRKLKIKVNRVQYFDEKELSLTEKIGTEAQVNASVENVDLCCDKLNFDEVKEIACSILKLCPRLKHFYLYAAESKTFPEFFTKEFIAHQASSQRQKIMELKQLLSTGRIKPHIKLKLELSGEASADDFEDHDADYWYDKNEREFAGWGSSRCHGFDTTEDNILDEEYFGFNICSTYLTFEDEDCKLELDVTSRIYSINLHNV